MTDNTRIVVRVTIGALIIIAFVVAGIASVDRGQPPAAHLVTIDSGEVAVIDLWNETRGTVTGQAHNGETVRLLNQEDTACEIETDAGQRGWVNCADVILEFK